MKIHVHILAVVLIAATACSQTDNAASSFKQGMQKYDAENYKGAMEDFSRAIAANDKYAEAYYYRGVCAMETEEFLQASKDYDKAVACNRKYAKGHYGRASIFMLGFKNEKAIAELDTAIAYDKDFTHAYVLRGQLRNTMDDLNSACEDFYTAASKGSGDGTKNLERSCPGFTGPGGVLQLELPADKKWGMLDNKDDGKTHVITVIPESEAATGWRESVNMGTFRGVSGFNFEGYAKQYHGILKDDMPAARLTIIEKDHTAMYPYILFSIDAMDGAGGKKNQSQLCYIVQGNNTVYFYYYAARNTPQLSGRQKEQWSAIFKKGIINPDDNYYGK